MKRFFKKRIVLIIGLVILALVGARVVWPHIEKRFVSEVKVPSVTHNVDRPQIINGELVYRDWET